MQHNTTGTLESVQTRTFIAGIYNVGPLNGTAVYIDSNGQLGTSVSSQRFKDDIRDMRAESDALYTLRPVAFKYKPEIDDTGTAQFGLVAEEVEKVNRPWSSTTRTASLTACVTSR